MMKPSIRRNHFTLVELLAAMAVFSILLLVSMQIFSGAQNIWLNAEKKTDVFSDARTALEFITSRLDTVHYSTDILFSIENRNTDRQKIYFATMMPMARPDDKHSVRFLSFQVVDDNASSPNGALKMAILSDNGDPNYEYLLPPFDGESTSFSDKSIGKTITTTRTNVFNAVKTDLDGKIAIDPEALSNPTNKVVVLAENVAKLRFNVYTIDLSANSRHKKKSVLQNLKNDTSSTISSLPYLLEIELTVFDTNEHYQKWKNTGDDNLLTQYSHTFKRSLLFGDRM